MMPRSKTTIKMELDQKAFEECMATLDRAHEVVQKLIEELGRATERAKASTSELTRAMEKDRASRQRRR